MDLELVVVAIAAVGRLGVLDRTVLRVEAGSGHEEAGRERRCLQDVGLFGVEDYDFWLRAAQRFRFAELHEDLYLYRKHGGSLTSQRAERIQALTAAIVERAMPDTLPARSRSEILLGLALKSHLRWRLDLVGRAFRADPAHVAARLPQIARWSLAVARNRIAA